VILNSYWVKLFQARRIAFLELSVQVLTNSLLRKMGTHVVVSNGSADREDRGSGQYKNNLHGGQ
jgi:hypothetical protein